MKKSLILLLLLMVGCSSKINYIEGNKIIRYGTKEFENFEKKSKIKKEEAWLLQNKITGEKHVQVHVTHWLFFIIDKNYVFTCVVNPQKRETELEGMWVNSETGEVKYKKYKINVKYENFFNGDNDKPFFSVKRKYRNKIE